MQGEPDLQVDVGFQTCVVCRQIGLSQERIAKDEEKKKIAGIVPRARHWLATPRKRDRRK